MKPFPVTRQFSLITAFHLCFCVFVGGSFLSVHAQIKKERVDLIIAGGTVVTLDGDRRVIEGGAVAVRGDTIVAVGHSAEIAVSYKARKRMDASGRIVLPGLINGHGHAPMTLLRGIADDLALQEWLEKYIFPAEAKNVNEEFVAVGTRLALAEMIRSGTTAYADMYYFEDVIARETKAAGVRGVLGETILEFPAPDNKTVAAGLEYTEAYLKKWQGDPHIRAAIAPHAVYTNSENSLRASAALARKYNAPILIHLSETKRENRETIAKYGVTPTALLERLEFLGPDVLAAHCVWVDAADRAILKQRDVGCVHNPSSNMKLASGVAPVLDMLQEACALASAPTGPRAATTT